MSTQVNQFIELMNADERQDALHQLMRALPPSAVKDAYASLVAELQAKRTFSDQELIDRGMLIHSDTGLATQ